MKLPASFCLLQMRTTHPLVIDANAIIVRCIMATANADVRGRTFTGGIHHSTLRVADLVKLSGADHVVAFFDGQVPQWRKDLIPGYKDRDSMEDRFGEDYEAVFAQLQDCFELWPTLGITCLTYANLEADDAVAAAVRVFAENGIRSSVMTSDADIFQCCWMGADVWDIAHKRWVTTDNFAATTGVWPSSYVLYRALVGDASDKIKGAQGVGEVKARALMEECRFSATLTPTEQLDRLVARLRNRQGKPKVFEQNIVKQRDELARIIKGTDLSDSFGGTKRLARSLSERAPVRTRKFLSHCKRLGMRSALADPSRFTFQFEAARRRFDAHPVEAL